NEAAVAQCEGERRGRFGGFPSGRDPPDSIPLQQDGLVKNRRLPCDLLRRGFSDLTVKRFTVSPLQESLRVVFLRRSCTAGDGRQREGQQEPPWFDPVHRS